MYLIINTAPTDRMEIILAWAKDYFKLKIMPGERKQSERLLAGIDEFLKINKSDFDKVKGIAVVNGPGRFTSIRIGVTLANVLAYGLEIPVVGMEVCEFADYTDLAKKAILKLSRLKPGSVVMPIYDGEPNITRAKPKK